MNFDIPKNQSIVVFANYRTGSTALCNWLSKTTGFANHDEAFHPNFLARKNIDPNKKFIVKIMPDHVVPAEFENLIKNSFVIGLQRKNLAEQIASFYICDQTHRWHQNKYQKVLDYEVPIDDLQIEDQVRYILKMQLRYDKLPYDKNTEIFYEDITELLQQSSYAVYHKPKNYQDLIGRVEVLIGKLSKNLEL